jgi:beta-glucanase (GH16 family)
MRCVGVILVVLAVVRMGGGSTAPAVSGHWKLIWGEEFAQRRLDALKWNATNTLGEALYDGELNSYHTDQLTLVDQNLVITTISRVNPRRGSPAYVSGRVTTKGKFSFLYGKVEVRAKLPKTRGIWPAIWMLPADRTWPPEIDIVEALGHEPQRVYMTNHWGIHAGHRQSQTSFKGPDFSADFHVFTLEWMPGQMRWLIDGVERKVTTDYVPDKAMYLIINTAVGGDWAGPPDRTTVLPQRMIVDWVRVYQHHRG